MHVEKYVANTNPTVDKIVGNLRKVYDPEIFTNIYDLGLIYDIDLDNGFCKVLMTLTSPFCPVGDELYHQVMDSCNVSGVDSYDVEMTFEPQWGPDMIPTHTKLEMGML
jgi:metal-sulfur cluster biosynthetic enzyme